MDNYNKAYDYIEYVPCRDKFMRELINCCVHGYADELNVMLLDSEIDIQFYISAENEYLFRLACEGGHLDCAKMLLNANPDINISACNNNAFKCACGNINIDVVKWLLELKPDIITMVDINAFDIELWFKRSCMMCNDDIENCKFILNLKPDINIHLSAYESAFILSCKYGNINIVKWLLEMKPDINVFLDDHRAFKTACLRGHNNIVIYLCDMFCDVYEYSIINGKISTNIVEKYILK